MSPRLHFHLLSRRYTLLGLQCSAQVLARQQALDPGRALCAAQLLLPGGIQRARIVVDALQTLTLTAAAAHARLIASYLAELAALCQQAPPALVTEIQTQALPALQTGQQLQRHSQQLRDDWLAAARALLDFLRRHAAGARLQGEELRFADPVLTQHYSALRQAVLHCQAREASFYQLRDQGLRQAAHYAGLGRGG